MKKMLKKISSRKLKYMRILATVAIAVATEAIGKEQCVQELFMNQKYLMHWNKSKNKLGNRNTSGIKRIHCTNKS